MTAMLPVVWCQTHEDHGRVRAFADQVAMPESDNDFLGTSFHLVGTGAGVLPMLLAPASSTTTFGWTPSSSHSPAATGCLRAVGTPPKVGGRSIQRSSGSSSRENPGIADRSFPSGEWDGVPDKVEIDAALGGLFSTPHGRSANSVRAGHRLIGAREGALVITGVWGSQSPRKTDGDPGLNQIGWGRCIDVSSPVPGMHSIAKPPDGIVTLRSGHRSFLRSP